MAFGNPYGDPWSPSSLLLIVEKLVESGVRRILLADTVGLAEAQTVHEVFSACRKHSPDLELGVHLHARPDRWEEVVMAAYSAGCRRFDGALSGMGGCPFAEDHLVGNIPTEGMVARFAGMGLTLDVTERVYSAGAEQGAHDPFQPVSGRSSGRVSFIGYPDLACAGPILRRKVIGVHSL